MYTLTDYNLRELRVIQAAIESTIQALNDQIVAAHKYLPESIHCDVTRKDNQAMVILREHNVHLLTAIQHVKDRETINAN